MKVVVFGPEQRVGALQNDHVFDLHAAYAKYARETEDEPLPYALAAAIVPSSLLAFIEAGPRALENAQKAIDYLLNKAYDQRGLRGEPLVYALAEVKLHAPLPSRGSRIMMAGGNYADHVLGVRIRRMRQPATLEQIREESRREGIWGFWKLAANVIGPDEDLIYPARTQRLDYEGEVTLVLGRKGKDIPAGRIGDYIWGYTLQNDWSLRDQRENPRLNFAMGKNFDGSSSLGPAIVVGEIPDPQDIPFETHVNGELRQRGNTRDMISSFAEFLEYLSRDMTLLPGDMISAGTCAGTAMDSSEYTEQGIADPKLFLKPGDVVEVSSPLIGTLRNRVVAKQ